MKYELICGIETHIELSTKTKAFCGCANSFGDTPNTHVCPICLGHPGVLPKLNKKVLEYAILAGLATNCRIESTIGFDRKNYFYRDLPKGYQITQNHFPICKNGYIELSSGKKIRINHIHIEEDAAKLLYDNEKNILIDYNRSGVPLIEVVSEPDLRTLSEIKEYLEKLRHIMRYIGVSDCKMQEGSMRCDVNVSVRKVGENQLNMKTELKNINSISHIVKAVEYEFKRQVELLKEGKEILRETRFYNENSKKTEVMRRKEDQKEYKYFKEPDIPMIKIEKSEIERLFKTLPEMPDKKLKRYVEEYNLTEMQAYTLVKYRKVAECFEEVSKDVKNKSKVANFIINEIFESLDTQSDKQNFKLPINEESLNKLMLLMDEKRITTSFAKEIYRTMVENNKDLNQIFDEKKQTMIDKKEIEKICKEVIKNNKKAVEDYNFGKKKAINILIEEVMKRTNKSFEGEEILKILEKVISYSEKDHR